MILQNGSISSNSGGGNGLVNYLAMNIFENCNVASACFTYKFCHNHRSTRCYSKPMARFPRQLRCRNSDSPAAATTVTIGVVKRIKLSDKVIIMHIKCKIRKSFAATALALLLGAEIITQFVRADDTVPQTELSIMFQWGEMNNVAEEAGKGRLIKPDSDFGLISQNWKWGTTRHADSKDVEEAFRKIKFKIIDESKNNEEKIVSGVFPENNTITSVSLGKYNSSHTYKVSVLNETIPSPYFITYNAEAKKDEFVDDVFYFTWKPSENKKSTHHMKCIRMDALEIIYAKDEAVAKDCFSYSQPKTAGGSWTSKGDWQFKYNEKNIHARLRVKNNAIQFPADKPIKTGVTFDGWQFYVNRKPNNGPYTSFDRMGDMPIENLPVFYSPFNKQTTTYPYIFALLRDNQGVNTFADQTGTQYGLVSRTFVVFPKWKTSTNVNCTVTFINENLDYAKVEVQAGHAIKDPGAGAQKMPADPSKNGYKFMGWNLRQDGKGAAFTADTVVNSDMKVYAIYDKLPVPQPSLNPVPQPTNGSIFPLIQVPECPTDPRQRQLQQPLQRQSDKNNDETVPKTGEATSCGALLLALAGTTTLIIGLRKKILPQVK